MRAEETNEEPKSQKRKTGNNDKLLRIQRSFVFSRRYVYGHMPEGKEW